MTTHQEALSSVTEKWSHVPNGMIAEIITEYISTLTADTAGLVERLRAAYQKVAEWPESRMAKDAVAELGEGFNDLLELRNLAPKTADTIAAQAAKLKRVTSPEYLSAALEKVGVVDKEWRHRAVALAAENAALIHDNKRQMELAASLTARITALEALVDRAGEWQPITEDDPAPPHDVPVLLWSPPSLSHPDGLIEARPYSTGRSSVGWSERSQHGYATHWMPLPSAPTLTAIKEARHGN